jgi:hypothetical protein
MARSIAQVFRSWKGASPPMKQIHESETNSRARPRIRVIALCLAWLPSVGCGGVPNSIKPPALAPASALFSITGNTGSANGSGASVTLTGTSSSVTTADSAGNYAFDGLSNGAYTVTPSKAGVSFNPPQQSTTIHGASTTGVNFSVSQPSAIVSISGTISPAAAAGGVTVTLSGKASATTTADSLGNYSFSNLSSGSYTLTPSKMGLNFAPSTRQVVAGASNVSEINFQAGSGPQNSGPIVINGQNGTVIDGMKITSTSGDCVTIIGSTNITIQNSEIGPCGGNGIKIFGGSAINIFDSYIHPETQSPGCCDNNDGIFATNSPTNLLIQGNVIAYGESNIEVLGGKTVNVIGNLLLNPRGPNPRGQNFQCWSHCSAVTVESNYVISSTDMTQFLFAEATVDSISFGMSNSFVVQNNFITGGHSPTGCGITLDTEASAGKILQNRLLDTGQCGIGISDGSHTVSNNHVYNRIPVVGGGNSALYVAHYGQSAVCGPIVLTDNIADALQPNGGHSGWWTNGSCGPTSIATDILGAAADPQLTPVGTVFAPPLIPPQPKNCVAFSPYSTQTSAPTCVP